MMQDESDVTDDQFDENVVDDFQRSLLAGAFLLNGWIEKDILPPNRVIDLQVETVSEQCVNLTWTAAGDDMDTGTANRTEIRYHNEAIEVYKNFSNGFLISENDVKNGTLVPVHGGKLHSVIICISIQNKNANTIYFALRNYDNSQNIGGISNIAEAHFAKEVVEQQIPVSQLTLFVVGAVVGAFILLILGLVFVRILRKHQLHEKEFKKTNVVRL
uniref:Fibronectin type-III domain-containing protein n=1 Tax=Strigamia maritima TaxID=126957 RepID=T1JI06_STRMM